jgi:hypothetical protein
VQQNCGAERPEAWTVPWIGPLGVAQKQEPPGVPLLMLPCVKLAGRFIEPCLDGGRDPAVEPRVHWGNSESGAMKKDAPINVSPQAGQ